MRRCFLPPSRRAAALVAALAGVAAQAGAPPLTVYADHFGSPQQVMEGLFAAKRLPAPPTQTRVRALVVPHHLVATQSIAAGVRSLEGQTFSRVVLLSPDHFHRCPTLVCTTNALFHTPLGDTRADPASVALLLGSSLVSDAPRLFEQEHGVFTVLPYLARFAPGVSVTPLVLSQRRPWKHQRAALLELMRRLVDEETVLVVSSDFSHYRSLPEADANDERTAQVLFSADLDGIAALSNPAQSDCPSCLWTVAALAEARGFYNPSVVQHSNSATLLGAPSAPSTTSHFSIAWYQSAALGPEDLAVAGDVTLTRGPPAPLAAKVADFWAGDGVRFVNLEGPVAEACPPAPSRWFFCNPASGWRSLRGLATHWGLVNNHMFDLGVQGPQVTAHVVQEASETPVTQAPWDGEHTRLLALTTLINPVPAAPSAHLQEMAQTALAALKRRPRPEALTVALVHGGGEYVALPSESVTRFAQGLIDAGADAVVVAHSHVVGDVTFYKERPIFRGVGNFVFDQAARPATSTARLVRLRKTGDRVTFESLIARVQQVPALSNVGGR